MESHKKLYRVKKGRIVAGVCTGFAEYFQIDVVLIRVVFIALLFAGGSGVLLYIILALIIPEEPGNPVHQAASQTSEHKDSSATHDSTARTVHETGETVKEFVHNMQDNAQKIAEDIKERVGESKSTVAEDNSHNLRNIGGMVIIAIGVLALFNSITGFHIFRWELFWPLVLIFVGAIILFKKRN